MASLLLWEVFSHAVIHKQRLPGIRTCTSTTVYNQVIMYVSWYRQQ